MSAGLNLLLVASAALFAVGVFGVAARRSAVVMLLGTQFMFMAGAIGFVAFARFGLGDRSQVIELASNDGYLLQWFV